jgi:DNA-binding MarR family transcriptional regulator
MSQAAPAPPAEGLASSFGLAFKGAMAAVRRLRGRDTHRPGELSYAQYGLLFGLAQGGELPASELAALADVAPGTATAMLDRLVESGLVCRARSERDRRLVLVSLTERGAEVVAQRRARYEPLWTAALGDFTAEELRAATAVLERVTLMFHELAEHADACEDPAAPVG